MKKVFKISLIIINVIMILSCFAACGDKTGENEVNTNDSDVKVDSFIVDNPDICYQFNNIETKNINAKVVYSNGNVKYLSSEDLTFDFLGNTTDKPGNINILVKYEKAEATLTIYVNKLLDIDVKVNGFSQINEDLNLDIIECFGIYENNNRKKIDNSLLKIEGNTSFAGENPFIFTYKGFENTKNISIVNKLGKNLIVKLNENVKFHKNQLIGDFTAKLFSIKAEINGEFVEVNDKVKVSKLDTSTSGKKTISFTYIYEENNVKQIATGSCDILIEDAILVCKTQDDSGILYLKIGEKPNKDNFKNFICVFFNNQIDTSKSKVVTKDAVFDFSNVDNNTIGSYDISVSYTDEFNVTYTTTAIVTVVNDYQD